MKLKTQVVAATVALGLLGGGSLTAADNTSSQVGTVPRRAVELTPSVSRSVSTAAGHLSTVGQPGIAQGSGSSAALGVGRVGLRTVKPCVFRGQVTRCVIKVRRLEQRGNRVVALGTITPRSNPGVHIPFHKRVVGVRDITGVHGLQQAPSCAIVGLVLGPLHLDVLGLVIDLNRVVLDIVGQTGPGNLLGNLLCALTGILDGAFILTRFLSVVTELLAAINAVLRL
jgi:hypothetical protein